MPTKSSQVTSLSAEQVHLLCQVVQHSESPKKESWDIIAQKLNITNGNAAQQRFGRLLKTLKSADPSGDSDRGTRNAKAAGKRAAPGKANSKLLKKPKAVAKCADEGGEGKEENHEVVDSEEETLSKKQKTKTRDETPKWKSIFGGCGDATKSEEEEEEEEEGGSGAATSKAGGDLDEETVK